jgi:hypothetical protein
MLRGFRAQQIAQTILRAHDGLNQGMFPMLDGFGFSLVSAGGDVSGSGLFVAAEGNGEGSA